MQPHHDRYRIAAAAAVAVLVLALAPQAEAQRESGIQLSPESNRYFISKDVNNERWAITRNDDGTVTGNVFPLDGGQPSFVWCEQHDDDDDGDFFDDFIDFIDDLIGRDDDDDNDDNDILRYSCYGAGPCFEPPCSEDQWTFIADVDLPESFFRP